MDLRDADCYAAWRFMATETTYPPNMAQFGATRWTLVRDAAGGTLPEKAQTALAELCRIYWYPLYAYVRRSGHERHDAEDLTQEFFARLLAKNALATVDRSKGKFRSFLLASIKHFLANEWDRKQTLKRGGGFTFVPLDIATAESRHPLEPAHELTPEKIFDRQWALALLDQVLARLSEEYAAEGKADLFASLKEFLVGQAAPRATAQLAETLGVSEGSIKVAIHRLRKRYRQLLRAEIAQTVSCAEEVDEEIRGLFAIFR